MSSSTETVSASNLPSALPHVAIDMTTFSDHVEEQRTAKLSERSRSRSRSPSSRSTANNKRSMRDLRLAETDAEPLIGESRPKPINSDAEIVPRRKPSLNPENVNDDEPDERPSTPGAVPGIDGGFFGDEADEGDSDTFDGPRLKPRLGGEDDSDRSVPMRPRSPFPVSPGLDGTSLIVPDVNVYQQKKTLAQGMMDLALLSANANQLRYVLESDPAHMYYVPSLVFISVSIILQVAVGVGLIWNSRYNVKDDADICKADKINNFTVMGIFLITIVNVFVSSFGVATNSPRS